MSWRDRRSQENKLRINLLVNKFEWLCLMQCSLPFDDGDLILLVYNKIGVRSIAVWTTFGF